MTGADAIAEILRRENTDFVACYPRNGVIEACARIGIRPILCRQERVGVGMAEGYSRVHQGARIGVFAPQAGPGIENSFPGVAQAFSDGMPILVLTGAAATGREHISPVFSAVDNFRHITKWATKISDAAQIPDVFRRAYHLMRNGRPGPVLIEIPNDVWAQDIEDDFVYVPRARMLSAPDPGSIAEAVATLRAAEAPIIWAGQGILRAGATDELVELAEWLNLPVMTTNPGKSGFPETHPLSLGGSVVSAPKPLKDYLNAADWVFAVGSSLSTSPFNPNMPVGKSVIHATNHSDDINKDAASEIGIVGDAKLVLAAMIAEVKKSVPEKPVMRQDVHAAKEAWLDEWAEQRNSDEVPLNQYRVLGDLMDHVDRDNTIITHDSGSPREQLFPFWEATRPGGYMGWGKSTQLGHGLGINMGAKLAAPDKLCINVMGDAAIGMVGMDIETAARNDIPILTIVLNNGVMAAERDTLLTSTEKYGAYLVGGNYKELANALGLEAFRAETADAFIPALKRAIAVTRAGKPALLECMVKEGYDFSR
ncbi:MAG: thiamine pyrophosphate-requiring protein [Rhodospirillaceae bacterium]|jgi:acetolactate synthase-1/2/3 large subunit|nr:thiamine pyrophosphate-requiring protein [Rhodospirillaceae bacterium]MBT3883745.1 thiamine pyrophosphate-requiring protein [Rhodospirillaceae bacterium]MBT4116339.1 thiamine pyrophosphate-requiring protein [Rhodospirillaceae bacterium]MBT4672323.1 thiamine pyrophosphate-requiring protein [Rhodospirillaceae bacterium]MBT4719602.1 thiamine pyrophosphate-requiring protein [Rhodospirillaceae bacterium]